MPRIYLILKRIKSYPSQKKAKITSRCNKLLHMWKKNLKKLGKSKSYQKIKDHCYCAAVIMTRL